MGRPWVMHQAWNDLLFAHWQVEPDRLQPLVPLPLDLFDGMAWVAVVPFWMSRIHLRRLPPVPGTHTFPELNLRTYVRVGGRPGVWFFSLDAASRPAVEVARRLFHLPYYHARMQIRPEGDGFVYQSERRDPRGGPARFAARYRPSGPVRQATPGSLEHWLTERYALYARSRAGRFYRGEIDHLPWPLQPAEAEITENSIAAAAGFDLPGGRPLLHYARHLSVRIWPLLRLSDSQMEL
ncbi:MAG: YqjF family protein [Bacillota bacterium]